MIEKLLRSIFDKYFDIVENNIRFGHYVETDFRHYSELVRSLVNKVKEEPDPIFFTALCIPPFKWFNFRITNPNAKSISEVEKMEIDIIWTDYLRFLKSLADEKINIYRCIFCFDDRDATFSKKRKIFRDLVGNSVIESQFSYDIVVLQNDILAPLANKEIKAIIGSEINNKYKCYKFATYAYLIIDELDDISYDSNVYDRRRLRDLFAVFQTLGGYDKWIYNHQVGLVRSLPEDFFLVGNGKDLSNAKWNFALAADVTKDLKKARIWFIAEDMPAYEIKTNGRYYIKFKFHDIINFSKNVVLPNLVKV